MLFHEKACPASPWEAQQGTTTPSPRLRWILHFHIPGPGGDRSRGLHTWGCYSLTEASPALTAAISPLFMDAIQNCGQQGDRGALFAVLLPGKKQQQPGTGNAFWKNFLAKWLPAFLCYLLHMQMMLTQQGKEQTP